MAHSYDDQNIFARILRGEIPCKKVLETEHTLAFDDINPARPTHVLVIPKGPYVAYDHFLDAASDAEIVDYFKAVREVARMRGLSAPEGGAGYRILSNAGEHGHQEVPHLHIHVFGGAPAGPMIKREV